MLQNLKLNLLNVYVVYGEIEQSGAACFVLIQADKLNVLINYLMCTSTETLELDLAGASFFCDSLTVKQSLDFN